VYNFVTGERTIIVITSVEIVAQRLIMFSALKQNPVGHRFLDDGEVDTVATRRLVTQNADLHQRGIRKLMPRSDE
jgi:hypothetical protein